MQDLLLLHGAIGSEEQLFPLRDLLNDHFNVHSFSFAGHGGKALPSTMSIDLFASEVLDYIEQKRLSNTLIFGYSMGGYVGMYFTHRYPHMIDKIATLGTKFIWTPEIAAKETKMLQVNIIEEKVPAFAQMLAKRHGANEWKMVLSATALLLSELGANPLLTDEVLNQINTKSMLMIGEKDNMVSQEETASIVQCLQNAELKVLPNTTHPIEQINTQMLAEELLRFFS